MPDLEQLAQFNKELIKLGKEPEIANRRGEAIEPVLSPAEYPMDHGGTGIRTNRAPEAEASEPSGSSTDDFLSQLDPDLFAEPSSAESPVAPVADEFDNLLDTEAKEPAEPSGDFDDLFDDSLLAGRPSAVPSPPPPSSDDDFNFEDLEEPKATPSSEEPLDFDNLFDEPPSNDFNAEGEAEVAQPGPEVPSEAANELDQFNIDDIEVPGDSLADVDDIDNLVIPTDDNFDTDFSELDVEVPEPDTAIPEASESPDNRDLPRQPEELDTDFGDDFANFDFGDDAAADAALPPEGGDESQAAEAPPPEPDFAMDTMPDFGSEDFADEFNMGDFGKDFGVMEELSNAASAKEPEIHQSVMEEVDEVIAKASIADEAEAWELSPADFKRVQESLAAMPLNLKVATEEALGNPNFSFDAILPLINALVRGESPKDIAVIVSRVTGKRIKIPAGYEKKTGLAFEQEQHSFAYQFRENILPMVKFVSLAVLALFVVGYAVITWIITPLQANWFYDRGLEAIHAEQYEQGNQLFNKAYGIWPDNNRFVQYGRAFRDMKQWRLARDKYEDLLGMPDRKQRPYGKERLHRQGIMEFADFAAYTLRDYHAAASYLQRLITINKYDHAPVLAQGDVFMEWARYIGPHDYIAIDRNDRSVMQVLAASYPNKGEPAETMLQGPVALYSAARFDYASLIAKEGQLDDLLSRMLRYFMRLGAYTSLQATEATTAAERAGNTGDFATQRDKEAEARTLIARRAQLDEEVNKIRKLFLNDPKAKPDPAIIAELAGDIIDKSEGQLRFMEDALTLGLKAEKSGRAGESEPSLHYQLARYYRFLRDQKREGESLKWARNFYEERQKDHPLDRFELRERIDTLIRQGELLYGPLYDGKDALNAQLAFDQARNLYEEGLQTRMIRERSSLFGRVYARLGDLKYYEASDYETALRQYLLAQKNQFGLPPDELALATPRLSLEELTQASQDISYKTGFIWTTLANRLPEGQADKALMYDQAAREFMQAQGAIPLQNDNLDFALANLSYLRGNYDSAVSQYRILADRVEGQRTKLSKNQPEEDVHQRELVEFLVRIDNNLGVSLYKLARQGGRYRDQNLAQGQFHVSRATELYQGISHNPLVPDQPQDGDKYLMPQHIGLAYLNLQSMVKSSKQGAVEIYRELRKDLTSEKFATVLTDGGAGR